MGAGTWESYHAITSLLYRYAECVDLADFEGLGRLFPHGAIRAAGMSEPENGLRGAERIRDFYKTTNRVHEDGTLRTRHLTTNVLLDIDEQAGVATSRSYYLVLQATPRLPFQPIVAGRYHDRFERVDGEWRFADRFIFVDQVGDVREHLTIEI